MWRISNTGWEVWMLHSVDNGELYSVRLFSFRRQKLFWTNQKEKGQSFERISGNLQNWRKKLPGKKDEFMTTSNVLSFLHSKFKFSGESLIGLAWVMCPPQRIWDWCPPEQGKGDSSQRKRCQTSKTCLSLVPVGCEDAPERRNDVINLDHMPLGAWIHSLV